MREKNRPRMKTSDYYISVAVSALCVLLSVWLILLGSSNQSLQAELQKQQQQFQTQQEQINAGNIISQQVGPNLLRDMAMVSVENQAMKDLLAKHGYTVTQATPAPGTAAAATPAPATPTPSAAPPR